MRCIWPVFTGMAPRVLLEEIDPPHAATERGEALVAADLHHLEHRPPVLGGAGQEARSQAVPENVAESSPTRSA
jgi:hypothetical protein